MILRAFFKNFLNLKVTVIRALCLVFFYLPLIQNTSAQIINLPCQVEGDAFIGLDRKDWNGGSTAAHSEGSMHNFDLPDNTFGDCKKISNVEITFTIINIDISNLPPDCAPPGSYYINISEGCPDFAPASCDVSNLIYEAPNNPLNSQTLNFTSPPEDFPFGGVLGVDIIPVMDVNCTNGQSAISSGGIILDYQICVTVTIIDEDIDTPADLGVDQTICPSGTTTLDPGSYTSYDWDPNGETSPTITVGLGNYTVTVTDSNGCTDVDDISVLGFPEPSITFNPSAPEVCNNGNIEVSVNENYNAYDWSNSSSGQTVMLSTGIYDVTITDINGCTDVNSIEVVNVPPPNAGIDNFLDVCNDGTTYNLDELLLAHDPGGMWSDNDASGVDVNANPTVVDFDNILPGTYTYTYTVAGTGPCPDDEAVITVEVFEENYAGISETVQYCENPGSLDFFNLLNNPDMGGVWSDLNGSGVDLSDPFSVNMDGLPAGVYTYNYLLAANGPCPDQTETLTVNIIEGADAGLDNGTTVCEGAQFDLQTLVNGANDTGVFGDIDFSGALSGSIVNTNGLAGQSFNFSFTVGSPASPCGEDIAIFTLNIESSLYAGDDALESVCVGGDIDLYDILTNEDAGGTFVDVNSSGGLNDNILTTDNITPGVYSYQYMVGDGVTCPQDDAEITITFFEDPSYDFLLSEVTVCIETCAEILVNLSGTPPFNFPIEVYLASNDSLILSTNINSTDSTYSFSICNDTSGNIFLNDTLNLVSDSIWYITVPSLTDVNCVINSTNMADTLIVNTLTNSFYNLDTFACITDTIDINGVEFFDGNSIFIDTLSGEFCDSIVNINVTFLDADTIPINETICSGDSILIEGIWFSEAIPNAEINIVNPNGCDSIIIIDVGIFPSADSLLNLELCSGDSIVINSTIYNSSNPTGTEILIGQSLNGCDSIVNISLEFSTAIMQFIADTLCQNQAIDVSGTIFDQSNPNGQVVLSGSGCDTIIDVNLSFHADAGSTFNETVCPEFSVMINGTLYDESNPSGVEILSNASQFACDSTVIIDLSFHTIEEGILDDSVCPNFSILVNGTLYDINNPSGTEILSNASQLGCDSTVNINLAFASPIVTDFTSDICDNESIDINGTTYDAGNLSGTEVITGGSSSGCDSTIIIQLTVLQTFNETGSISICDGDSIFLAGDWQFVAGDYIDNFQSTEMCDSIVTTTVIIMPCEFVVTSSTVDNNCALGSLGEITLNLPSEINSSITISWTGSSSGTSGTINSDGTEDIINITNLVSDNYTIQIFDSNNDLLWEESITIIDVNLPLDGSWSVVDSVPCLDGVGTIQFDATGGLMPYNYNWDPNTIGNTNIAQDISAGDYALTISDLNGCSLETTFSLNSPTPFSASISSLDLSCDISNDGQISIFNITGGSLPYSISINNMPSDSMTISGLSAGVYIIDITDANNCLLSFTEELVVANSQNFATYTEEYTILQGDSLSLEGTVMNGNFTFEWINNNQSLSCTDCPNPVANPSSTTIYDLIITDEIGCSQSISILVEVEILEIVDVVPNIFSPNGDNNNDEFKFISNNPLTIGLEMSIYDRWGDLMFDLQSAGNEIAWNGTGKGKELNSGVYVYKLNIIYSDGTSKTLFGDVLLLR